jgi:hypothetical protein
MKACANPASPKTRKSQDLLAGFALRGLGWFEVTELRGLLDNGTISEYQVTLKVGFHVLDRDAR